MNRSKLPQAGAGQALRRQPTDISIFFASERGQKLLDDVRSDFRAALAVPFRKVALGRGVVAVEFMGVLRFISDSQHRTLSLHVSDGPEQWRPLNIDLDIYRPLDTNHWLTLFTSHWLERPQCDMDYIDFVELVGGIKRTLQRELMSKQPAFNSIAVKYFRQAGLLNEEAHFLAMTSQPKHRRDILNSKRYNLTWQHIALLRQTADEAPALLPLVQLGLIEGTITAEGGTQQLKQVMRASGLSKNGWKLLCQHGEQLYDGLKRGPEGCLTLVNIARHIHLFTQAKPGCCPPRALQRALYRLDTLNTEQITQLPVAFIRHAWDAFNQRKSSHAQTQFIKDELLPLLMWLRADAPLVDKNQRRAGWTFWLNAYEDWVEQRCEMDYENVWRVATQLRPINYGNYLALPITDTKGLIEEGESMLNCVADLAEECAGSTYLVFSIRDKASFRQLATLGLTQADKRWKVDQVEGIGNSRAGLNLRRVAIEICTRVNLTT